MTALPPLPSLAPAVIASDAPAVPAFGAGADFLAALEAIEAAAVSARLGDAAPPESPQPSATGQRRPSSRGESPVSEGEGGDATPQKEAPPPLLCAAPVPAPLVPVETAGWAIPTPAPGAAGPEEGPAAAANQRPSMASPTGLPADGVPRAGCGASASDGDARPVEAPSQSATASETVEFDALEPGRPGAPDEQSSHVTTAVKDTSRETAFLKQLANCETKAMSFVPAGPQPPESEAGTLRPSPRAPRAAQEPAETCAAPSAPTSRDGAEARKWADGTAEETPVVSAPPGQASSERREGAPSRMQVAFRARLTPVETVTPVARPTGPDSQPTAESGTGPPRSPAERIAAEPARSRGDRAPVERAEPAEFPPDEAVAPPEAARPLSVAPRAEQETARPGKPAESVEPNRPVAPAAPPPPKAAPVARDIRIEVASAERKVEVRLVERTGGVELAVRTPDERLAGSLREHLPLLSSRLEQGGFHADHFYSDPWHAEGDGAARRDVPASSESAGQTPEQRQGGGREQPDREERRAAGGQRSESQEKGNEFEWLMESLR